MAAVAVAALALGRGRRAVLLLAALVLAAGVAPATAGVLALRVLGLAGVLVALVLVLLVALVALVVLALGLVVVAAGDHGARAACHQAEGADQHYESPAHVDSSRSRTRRGAMRLVEGPHLDLVQFERGGLPALGAQPRDDVLELVLVDRGIWLALPEEHVFSSENRRVRLPCSTPDTNERADSLQRGANFFAGT